MSKTPTRKENTPQLSLCACFSGYRCIFPCVYFYSGYACFCDVYREPGVCIWVGWLFLVLGGAVFLGDGLDLVGIFVGSGFSLFYLFHPSRDCVPISRIHHILASRSLTPQTHLVTSTLWLRHRKHKAPYVHPSAVGGVVVCPLRRQRGCSITLHLRTSGPICAPSSAGSRLAHLRYHHGSVGPQLGVEQWLTLRTQLYRPQWAHRQGLNHCWLIRRCLRAHLYH